MKDMFTWFLYPLVISFLGMYLMSLAKEDTLKQLTNGLTTEALKEMKQECEKDLTRSQNCIIVVSYKPEGKEEESK